METLINWFNWFNWLKDEANRKLITWLVKGLGSILGYFGWKRRTTTPPEAVSTASGGGVAVKVHRDANVTFNQYSKDPADQERIKELERQVAAQSAEAQAQYRQGFLDAQKLAQSPQATQEDKKAFADLQSGRLEGVSASAQEQEAAAAQRAQADNAEAAKWARYQAVFEQLAQPNSQKSVEAMRRAVAYQPEQALNWGLLGDAEKRVGNSADALAAYRKAFTIFQKLAESDPNNSDWQSDLSVSYERVAVILEAQGEGREALGQYQKSLAIRQKLAERDPRNVLWQTDVALSFVRMAGVAAESKERNQWLDKALDTLRPLDDEGRLSAKQKGWIALIERRK